MKRHHRTAARVLAEFLGEPVKDCATFVYFAQGCNSGIIKIGFTTKQPFERLYSLKSRPGITGDNDWDRDEEIKILAAVPGDRKTEKALHRKFAAIRIRSKREWFRPTSDIISLIDKLGGCEAVRMNRTRIDREAAASVTCMSSRKVLA